jgi:peptide/nickel transport system permease protein
MIGDQTTVGATAAPLGTQLDLQEGVRAEQVRFRIARRFLRHRLAIASLILLLIFAVIAILGTAITPYDPYQQTFSSIAPPSGAHWLGTDEIGRDELSRVLLGARISLGISVGASLVATFIGLLVGMAAGYFGKLVDNILMRLVDLVLAFPALFLILVIAASTGVNVLTIILLIGGFSWMYLARLVRAEFLRLRELEYVQAARALSVPGYRIMVRHILPNAVGPIVVGSTFIMAGALYAEASLDFLGFGLSPDIPSWGNLLNSAEQQFYNAPLLAIVPGALLTVTILALNFVGDGLRDAFDPRRHA